MPIGALACRPNGDTGTPSIATAVMDQWRPITTSTDRQSILLHDSPVGHSRNDSRASFFNRVTLPVAPGRACAIYPVFTGVSSLVNSGYYSYQRRSQTLNRCLDGESIITFLWRVMVLPESCVVCFSSNTWLEKILTKITS